MCVEGVGSVCFVVVVLDIASIDVNRQTGNRNARKCMRSVAPLDGENRKVAETVRVDSPP